MSEINEKKSWYLKCKPADIAKQVILVGDPARVTLFAEQMTAAEIVAEEREFTTLTGQYQETNISVVSVGIGAPSTGDCLGRAVGIRGPGGYSRRYSLGA